MSDETKVDTAATPPTAPKKKKQTLIIAGVVIIAIVIVIALLVANAMIQSQPPATANIKVTSFTINQSLSGPTTFTVTVSNDGSDSGSGTVYCSVSPTSGNGAYTNTQIVNLDPGSSKTISIIVETPFGMTVTKSMCVATIQ
jgi:hypothetical protein